MVFFDIISHHYYIVLNVILDQETRKGTWTIDLLLEIDQKYFIILEFR